MAEHFLAGKRILIVEDEYFIAEGPVGLLPAALEYASTSALEGAVLDLDLSGKASYSIADALAARAVPFVSVTGYDGASMPPQYRGVPRLTKPFSSKAVVECLRRLFDDIPV